MLSNKKKNRTKRHRRVRAKISGTSTVPRVSVFRSNRHVFVQMIDDTKGKTLVGNAIEPKKKIKTKTNKTELAGKIGEALAQKAKETGISKIVFDRGGYK